MGLGAHVHGADALGVGPDVAPTYFHQLLARLGGWAQVGRQRLWQAELAEGTDATTTDLLAIRLVWERALLELYGPEVEARWIEVRFLMMSVANLALMINLLVIWWPRRANYPNGLFVRN